jgi:hypothetical protein
MGLERFELVTISSYEDLRAAYDLGWLNVHDEFYCEACDIPVGEDLVNFEPFCLVVNEKREAWLVCEACHCDTTHPTVGLD